MTGNNQFHLNQATMIEAIQHWLNHKLLKTVKVYGVAEQKTGGSSTFVILITDPDKEENVE